MLRFPATLANAFSKNGLSQTRILIIPAEADGPGPPAPSLLFFSKRHFPLDQTPLIFSLVVYGICTNEAALKSHLITIPSSGVWTQNGKWGDPQESRGEAAIRIEHLPLAVFSWKDGELRLSVLYPPTVQRVTQKTLFRLGCWSNTDTKSLGQGQPSSRSSRVPSFHRGGRWFNSRECPVAWVFVIFLFKKFPTSGLVCLYPPMFLSHFFPLYFHLQNAQEI